MISSIKVLLVGALAGLVTVAAAQSPLEDAARQQAGTARYMIATSKQCAAIERRGALMTPQLMKDKYGRISTARNEYGQDFAFEYLGADTTPVAIIANGRRVEIDRKAAPDMLLFQKLRARAILYNQVKAACGISQGQTPLWEELPIECYRPVAGVNGGHATPMCSGGGWPGTDAWFEAPFWESEWEPGYIEASQLVVPTQPQCLPTCQTFCSDTSRSFDIACGGMTLIATGFIGPIWAGIAGIACLSGSHIGNIWCRDYTCPSRC
jgi:hypothetical protein